MLNIYELLISKQKEVLTIIACKKKLTQKQIFRLKVKKLNGSYLFPDRAKTVKHLQSPICSGIFAI